MFYQEYAPPPALAPFLRCIWILERHYKEPYSDHEHLWADANGELILNACDPYFLAGDERQEVPQAFVIGPYRTSFDLYCDGAVQFVAARFCPWGFRAFTDVALGTLVNAITPATRVFGDAASCLQQQIADMSRDARVEALCDFLSKRLRVESDDLVRLVGSRIDACNGKRPISEIAREEGVSPRQLQRMFVTETGLSAKAYARIVRFNYARTVIQCDPDISLARLAAMAGYADQAHFSRAFRELFDLTPAAFKAQVTSGLARITETRSSVVFLQDG